MTLASLEEETLYRKAQELFKDDEPALTNAQISGLLNVINASGVYKTLRDMAQRQRDKARKEGDWAQQARADFYDQLLRILLEVEKLAEEHVRRLELGCVEGKLTSEQRRQSDECAGQLARVFMQHVAAEHRWRGVRR